MNTQLRIGQLSQQTQVPEKTIRFYESIQLIKKPKRLENGYRIYDEDAVEELHMIKYARDLGFSIEKIKTLMNGCQHSSCSHTKQYMKTEISSYMDQITQRIEELETLKNELKELTTLLSTTDAFCTGGKYCCNILHQLIEMKKGGHHAM